MTRSFFSKLDGINRTTRLLISLMIGLLVFAVTWWQAEGPDAALLAWISFSGILLFFSWVTILRHHPRDIGEVAGKQDASRLTIFVFVLVAAIASLVAIVLLLQGLPSYSKRGLSYHILLAFGAVSFSWLLIHTLFTLRYAHLYYNYKTVNHKESNQPDGGLEFPGHQAPNFLDFAYFSFILGMTFQVSDVSITARRIRQLALLHGLLSFVFNTFIVALCVNIVSGIVGR
jgi:uncharacterized membrane protein